jgi:hypothetical protein
MPTRTALQLSAVSVLGILGFALSVVAVLWNLTLTWLKWPRIRVEIFPIVGAAETYRLIIVNLGSEAITLRSVGLGTRTTPHALDFAKDRFAGRPLPEGADLPARIEGHDLRVWTYNEQLLTVFPRGTMVIGYADRYKAFGRAPRDTQTLLKTATSKSQLRNRGVEPTPQPTTNT